ncbi:MAG TPA: DinB family protein [Polyangiaceae bacterium]|nr:DinB family protein [Polyangiaceae bacterium]
MRQLHSTERAAETAGDDLAKVVVRRQMIQAGNTLLLALEPLSDEEFFAGGLNGISPAWTVGHLACVTDLFASWMTGQTELPRPMHDVFNSLDIGRKSGTKADAVDRAVYPKAELLLLFRQSQVRALQLLDVFDVGLWDVATPRQVPETLPTWGAIWQALGVHCSWHLGELSGAIERFHGTYTLNSVVHYFYTRRESGLQTAVVPIVPARSGG